MEDFRELHNNTVPKKHDSPLNITPLTHVSDGLYIECPPPSNNFLQQSVHFQYKGLNSILLLFVSSPPHCDGVAITECQMHPCLP
jgi:hypothetical protein